MLVLSFIGETRILKLSQGEELEEIDQYCGFDVSRPTIATANIVGNLLAQVCFKSRISIFYFIFFIFVD
jgi:hypothetical protein